MNNDRAADPFIVELQLFVAQSPQEPQQPFLPWMATRLDLCPAGPSALSGLNYGSTCFCCKTLLFSLNDDDSFDISHHLQ